MSVLTKLKSFYTLSDTATRLTAAFGENVTTSDVLQFVLDGRLPLAAQFLHQYAMPVAPYTRLWNWYGGKDDDPSAVPVPPSSGLDSTSPVAVEGLARQSDEIIVLNGVYRLALDGPLAKAYVQLLLMGHTKKDFKLTAMDGILVLDDQGCRYELREKFARPTKPKPAKDSDSKGLGTPPKAPPPHRHPNNFFPSVAVPLRQHLAFRTVDLLSFEYSLLDNVSKTDVERPPGEHNDLRGTERKHYLKVIAGLLASAGISPIEAVTEVQKLLEGKGGQTKIDRATLSSTLKEANKFRP